VPPYKTFHSLKIRERFVCLAIMSEWGLVVHCHSCGKLLPPVGLFCPVCGTKRLIQPTNQKISQNTFPILDSSRDAVNTDGFDFRLSYPVGTTNFQKFRDGIQISCYTMTALAAAAFWFLQLHLSYAILIVLCSTIVHSFWIAHTGFGYEKIAFLKLSFLLKIFTPAHIWLFSSVIILDIVLHETQILSSISPDSFLILTEKGYFFAYIGMLYLIWLPYCIMLNRVHKSRFKENPEQFLRPGF
jgi:hypothetical protein